MCSYAGNTEQPEGLGCLRLRTETTKYASKAFMNPVAILMVNQEPSVSAFRLVRSAKVVVQAGELKEIDGTQT